MILIIITSESDLPKQASEECLSGCCRGVLLVLRVSVAFIPGNKKPGVPCRVLDFRCPGD